MANDRAEARSNAAWARERRAADGVERERPVQHHEDDSPAPSDTPAPADGDTQPAPAGQGETDGATTPAGDSQQPATDTVVPVAVLTEPVVAEAVTPQPVTPVNTGGQTPAAAAAAATVPAGGQPAATGADTANTTNAANTAQTATGSVPGEADAQSAATQQPGTAATDAPVPGARSDASSQPAPASAPADKHGAGNGAGGKDGDPSGQQRQPGTLPQQAADQARTIAQAYGRAAQTDPNSHTEVPTQTSGTPAATPATPVAGAQPAAATRGLSPATPVPLSRAAENVEHVLRLAATRGVTHARIALNPVELGSIDVHLRHTAEGLVAKVVAHSPEAVQQLQQAAADLRRQLEDQGVNLLGLDIGQSGDERGAGRAGADAGRDEGRRSGGDGSAAGAEGAEGEPDVRSNLQLPNGVLVDVLA